MAKLLITHGKRYFGFNPTHTPEGIEQIRLLGDKLPENGISLVVVGTGLRFHEIHETLEPWLGDTEKKFSPFCGSCDGLEADGRIILFDGTTVPEEEYISLINSSCFDPWKFIEDFPEGTLFCAGGELMVALGLKEINEKGQLFKLDPATKTGRKIS